MILEGKTIRLVPPDINQADDIWNLIGPDENLWKWTNNGFEMPRSLEDVQNLYKTMVLNNGKDGLQFFTMQEKKTGKNFGLSVYLDVNQLNRHLEIGGTFIAPQFQGGTTNYEVKLLMLTEAFEKRNCARVTFKADTRNTKSRRAIEKIGATFEGILRKHRLCADGVWRDSAYYSILDSEWPNIKKELERRIGI